MCRDLKLLHKSIHETQPATYIFERFGVYASHLVKDITSFHVESIPHLS